MAQKRTNVVVKEVTVVTTELGSIVFLKDIEDPAGDVVTLATFVGRIVDILNVVGSGLV